MGDSSVLERAVELVGAQPEGQLVGKLCMVLGRRRRARGRRNDNDDAGAETRQAMVRVENGRLHDEGLPVHFPIPMRQAWHNVIYTCSTMLLFESETKIDDWRRRHRIPKGNVQPLSRVFEFAKVWYGRHADPDWKKWSSEEARAIFERFGLTGPTWDIPTSTARF